VALIYHLETGILVAKEDTPSVDIHGAVPLIGGHCCTGFNGNIVAGSGHTFEKGDVARDSCIRYHLVPVGWRSLLKCEDYIRQANQKRIAHNVKATILVHHCFHHPTDVVLQRHVGYMVGASRPFRCDFLNKSTQVLRFGGNIVYDDIEAVVSQSQSNFLPYSTSWS
jgi:hypothetical protein